MIPAAFKMAATPPLEEAQVLISNQLNTLQLATELPGGGESLRESVETNYYTFQAGKDHAESQKRQSSPIVKEEELSEEESPTRDNTSTPSTPETDPSTMLNIEKLERQARFRAGSTHTGSSGRTHVPSTAAAQRGDTVSRLSLRYSDRPRGHLSSVTNGEGRHVF